jgi:low temperature requirement protein LtrA
MRARRPDEAHRTATPLELLFDLVFVVAIAQAGSSLHHALAEGHVAQGLVSYALVFFAIWWAWMNFTWFASAYDCDDVPYRLAVFVQMTGALILAAAIPDMFARHDLTMGTMAYVVMRLAAVAQWLRAAVSDPGHRRTALRYAIGITVVQAAWVLRLLTPDSLWLPGFVLLAIADMGVPVWAERAGGTTWHPHHITERYGLMTIIALGESILAAALAVQQALSAGERFAVLAPIILGGLLIVYGLWWLYFDHTVDDLLTTLPKAIVWGYGHYVIFGSVAAVGAGLAVAVDHATGHGHPSDVAAGAVVAVPVAVYLVCLWRLHRRPGPGQSAWLGPAVAALVLLTPFTGQPVLMTGLIVAGLLGVKLVLRGAARRGIGRNGRAGGSC